MRVSRFTRLIAIVLPWLLVTQVNAWPVLEQDQAVPPKLNIVIVEGEGAINNVRQRVAREPIVQVEDENHRPVGGAVVTFLLPNQGAGGSFANGAKSLTVTTDSKGQAIARGLKPNNASGQYQIRVNASYNNQTASTTISQTNAVAAGAGGAAAGGISAKLIIILAVAAAGGIAGGVAATRGGGTTAPAGATPTTITPGSPTIGAPR
jgi:hypothetical protein